MINHSITAVCFPPDGCRHGGVCASHSTCSCTEGWTGASCDERMCIMILTLIVLLFVIPTVCVIIILFTLLQFFVAICLPSCLNGECYLPGTCYCDRGWTGPYCRQRKYNYIIMSVVIAHYHNYLYFSKNLVISIILVI